MAEFNEVNGVEGADDIISGIEQDVVNGLGAVRRDNWRGRINNHAQAAANRARNTRSANLLMNEKTSHRAWFEETKQLLPQDLQTRIANKEMQINDVMLYAIKDAASNNRIELFKPADAKEEGVTNLNKAQLEKDEMFLCCELLLIIGTKAAAGDAVHTAEWSDAYPAALRQGRISLTVGEVPIIHDYSLPVEMFNTDRTDIHLFRYTLSVPKWIKDQKVIKPELILPVGLPALSVVKFAMRGVQLKSGSPMIR